MQAALKNNINDMISSTKQNFIQVNNILEEYVKYNYREELKLDGIEKGGVFEALITQLSHLKPSSFPVTSLNRSIMAVKFSFLLTTSSILAISSKIAKNACIAIAKV